jgi:hypothetical protein
MSRRLKPFSSSPHRGRAVIAAVSGIACVAALAVMPASASVGDGDHHRGLPVLKGTVGPGFTITINDSSVPAGRYKIVVKDEGTIHNWHIMGAGVDKATGIPFTGKQVFKVRLKTGSYLIQCDAHSASMNTTLSVT